MAEKIVSSCASTWASLKWAVGSLSLPEVKRMSPSSSKHSHVSGFPSIILHLHSIMKFTSQAATVLALATTASCAAGVQRRDSCTADVEATQVRLAYHGDRGMSISWNTNAKLDKPSVAFGTTMQLGGVVTSDQSFTYPTSSTYNNHVVITGLQPNTRYHYQPYCSDRIYSFTTARTAGDGHDFKFAMVGDMGTMGPDGLSTTVGKGAANPLKPGDKTSIDSLHELKESFDFVFHGQSTISNWVSVS